MKVRGVNWTLPRSRFARMVLAAAMVCAITPGLSGCPQPQGTRPRDGKKIDVGGYEIFYRLSEGAGPTVVLMSGLNDDLAVWNKVYPLVAENHRVLAYDRGGIGWSDRGPDPRDGSRVVEELRAVFQELDVPPPYILVAHSFGGLFARLYAASYPESVSGIVLIDTTHEDTWDRNASELDPVAAQRIENKLTGAINIIAPIGALGEWQNRNNTSEAIRANRRLPDIPLVLLTPGRQEFDYLLGTTQDIALALERELDDDQASIVPRNKQIPVPGVGHGIHKQRPDVVVDAIEEVIQGW